jgi:predicted permease
MSRLREWSRRLLGTVQRGRSDDDLQEELRLHAALAAESARSQAQDPADAARGARIRLGGHSQTMDALRDQRGLPWLDDLARDARHALRLLRRSPVFAAVAIASLALGIGANAAIFHLIDAVRLRSLPVPDPYELVEVRPDGPQAFGSYESVNARITYPLFEQLRTHQEAFTGVFAWGDAAFVVGRGAEARPAHGLWVSGEVFDVLGLSAARGRLLAASDDRRGCGAGPAVISDGFWKSHFGGIESIVGRTLTVFDQTFVVVGVTPPAFTGFEVGRAFDVALPICSAELWASSLDRRDRWWLAAMGRLKPDWTITRASEHVGSLSAGVFGATVPDGYGSELLDGYRKLRLSAIPAGHGVSRLRESVGTPLSLLLGLTSLLLLITCSNVATLMLARASARQREIAVRAAVGASRPRLVSQMLVESLMVAAAGAALAVPVAVAAARALVVCLDSPMNPISLDLAPEWRLLGFVGAASVLTAALFGVIPALRVSLVSPLAAMHLSRGQTVDRHRARFQRGLVAVQVTVSLVLVVSALMFVRTFRNLATVETGFEQDGTLVVSLLDLTARDLPAEQKVTFQQQLADAVRSVPGVAAAASTMHVPLSGGTWSHFFTVPGSAGVERKASRFAYVAPEYFSTLRIPIRNGRGFADFDTATSHRVMVVNDSFVRAHLGGINPVGATIRTLAEPEYPETTYEIVGVVGDTKYAALRDENCWCEMGDVAMPPLAYIPLAQNPSPYAWNPVVVRTAGPLSGIAPAIAERVGALNPGIVVAVTDVRSFVEQTIAGERLIAWLAGAFGILATILVVVGLYGLVAYLVAGRRSEIGVRLSLGSTRGEIVRLVLRDSVAMPAVGALIGLPVAAALTRSAEGLLFGVSPIDGFVLAGATLLLVVSASLAGGIPAFRASRLDPADVLRAE